MKLRSLAATLLLTIAATLSATAARPLAALDTLHIPTSAIVAPAVVTVALPSAYLQPGNTTRYPVVYLLNGYGGNHLSFAQHMPLDSLADAHGVILVCPDGRDSWYFDAPADPSMQMETYIIRDLIPTIDARLRTLTGRTDRAITGYSMGGHGALWLAMRHADLFGSAGSMSGGVDFDTPRFRNNWKIKLRLGEHDANPRVWQTHTVVSLVPSLKPDEQRIIVSCGSEDFFIEVNDNLHRALLDHSIDHVYSVSPGNHSWPYWNATLPLQLDFFDQSFSAPCLR